MRVQKLMASLAAVFYILVFDSPTEGLIMLRTREMYILNKAGMW